MVPELEKARVTELQVRMDCNGCVHKIKKAMHGIDGIYDVYIDFPQQKVTLVGRADPERIVRAIKKTRKIATICSHTEPAEAGVSEPPPAEPATNNDPPAPEPANQPPPEAPPAEPEPPKDAPVPENPAPEVKPSPEIKADVEEIHMVHHYPHNYVYREQWNNYPPPRHEEPYYVTHSYNNYRPSGSVSEYGYLRSPQPNGIIMGRKRTGASIIRTGEVVTGTTSAPCLVMKILMHVGYDRGGGSDFLLTVEEALVRSLNDGD